MTTQFCSLVWCGPRSDGLAWLMQRLQERTQVIELGRGEPIPESATKLVYALDSRLDWDQDQLEQFIVLRPEIPLAVATSDWWNGASRTGIRQSEHLVLPWYRWLDGWIPWLEGTTQQYFEPVPPRLPFATTQNPSPISMQPPAGGPRQAGLVIANDGYLAQAWIKSAEAIGSTAQWLRPHTVRPKTDVDWILWDDSALDRSQPDSLSALAITDLAQQYPGAIILTALAMPRWDLWQRLEDSGASQLIAKPAGGWALFQALRLANSANKC